MNKLKYSVLAISALTLSGISMQASSFNNNVGVSGVGLTPTSTYTFDSTGLAPNTVITNQFAGVTFSTPLFYDGNNAGGGCAFNDFGGDCIANFATAPGRGVIAGPTTPFSIFFSNPQVFAAFALITDNNGLNNTQIQVFRGLTLIETALFTTGNGMGQAATVPNFFGFYNTSQAFDRITVTTSGLNLAVFDNLQGSFAPVPEPGTIGLLALGLSGVVAIARRRRTS